MILDIHLTNETEGAVLNHEAVRSIALPLMEAESLSGEWLLELRFVDTATMQRLNHQAQGRNEPTDVLSFPVHFAAHGADPTTIFPPAGAQLLGSLVIAPVVAAAQAARFNRTTKEELRFLVDHGIRHLLGYDHDDNAQWLPRATQRAFVPRATAIRD